VTAKTVNGEENEMNEQLVTECAAGAPGLSPEAALIQLERQIERGSLFTHTALGRTTERLGEVESFVYGLIDALIAKGIVSSDDISTAMKNIQELMPGVGEPPMIGAAIRPAETEQDSSEPATVDCDARMHICHSVCCKLDFALSAQEIETGSLKWDLGRPYFIRHEADGLCTHNDRATGGCSVYADRPSICRKYSCEHDDRIWKDFERMELNHEWLSEHLSESRPRALRVLMQNRIPNQPRCGEAAQL